MTTRLAFVAALLLFSACTTQSAEPTDGTRHPIGKADSVGSCVTSDCNGPSPGGGNCWCDADCAMYGDCCPDKVAVCDGPVAQSCGGLGGSACGAGEYCHWEQADMCGAADQLGTCEPVPQACIQLISEVCGCDGVTYSNSCFAAMAGASVVHDGACQLPPGTCGGFAGLLCDIGMYCKWDQGDMCGAADQLGTCAPMPGACTLQFDPVCGCDNQTYSNDCFAAMAGVSVVSQGACN